MSAPRARLKAVGISMGVFLLAWPGVAALAQGEPPTESSGKDSVSLRDGTSLRGTILRVEPGRYVLLLNASGARTIPWEDVARVETPARSDERGVLGVAPAREGDSGGREPGSYAIASERAAGPPASAWAGVSLGWDVRLEGSALWKQYTVRGRGVWFRGAGAGVGTSLFLHFRTPPSLGRGGRVQWTELQLGVGDAVHYDTWSEGADLSTAFVENEIHAVAGLHVASGRWAAPERLLWSGVVFGLAWVPTYIQFISRGDFASGGQVNPAGVRFTFDWGEVGPGSANHWPALRAFVVWLPGVGNAPMSVSAGLGCISY